METVNLIIKEEMNGERIQKTVPFEIDDITVYQFKRLTKVLKKAFEELQKDDGMNEFLEDLFGEDKAGAPTDPKQAVEDLDKDFMMKLFGGFDFIAQKLPERAVEIVAVMSDIDVSVIDQQKFVKLLDIYDAVLKVNDIELLVNRLKKSFGATKAKMTFMQMAKKATS